MSKPPTASMLSRLIAAAPKTKLRSRIARLWSAVSKRQLSVYARLMMRPSDSRKASVVRRSRSGRALASSASASIRSGRKVSSASRSTAKSPVATRLAASLAEPSPPLAFRTSSIRLLYGARAASRSSVEPSSQTTISRGSTVWDRTDSSASPIVPAAWYAGMSTEKLGTGPRSNGMVAAGARNVCLLKLEGNAL